MSRPGTLTVRAASTTGEYYGHLAQPRLADDLQSLENVGVVADPKFGIRRNAKNTLSDPVISDPAWDPRVVEFLFDVLHLGSIRG